jgi:hypothetical protein
MPIVFHDDGSFQAPPGTAIPQGWVQQAQDNYVPTWPVCRYRRLSCKVPEGVPHVAVHCLLLKFTGTINDCLGCPQAETHDSNHPDRSIPADDSGRAVGGVVFSPRASVAIPVSNMPPQPGPVVTTAVPAFVSATPEPRPDMAAIALTLPAADSIKDAERTFQRPIFHDDGSIEYPKREGDWEPPQNINGYVRDTDNKWLFHPLWPPCVLRHQMAFLKANCGCIDVVMRCNSPQSPAFGQRLAHETCANCPVRIK